MTSVLRFAIFLMFVLIAILFAISPAEKLAMLLNVIVRFIGATVIICFGAWLAFYAKQE